MNESYHWLQSTEIEIASNRFVNVPIIIQVEETPILQFVPSAKAGYTTKFPVYHEDGTKIAVVKGSHVYLTKEGRRANVRLVHEPNLVTCEHDGKQILELRRDKAAAMKGWAELYAPQGYLVRATESELFTKSPADNALSVRGMSLQGNEVKNVRIGILINSRGVGIGVS